MPAFVFKHAAFDTTADVPIPKNPLEQVIGQDEAVQFAQLAARQKRHLLLVGPPGTGKSMLAQAMAFLLPKPSQEVSVLHNPANPERPMVEVRSADALAREQKIASQLNGRIVTPGDVPAFVAERLGFRCRRCGRQSPATSAACPACGADKFRLAPTGHNPFGDLLATHVDERANRVHTTRTTDGREEVIVYERTGDKIRVLDQRALEQLDALNKRQPRHVIVPLGRSPFVSATGASETELLGDVRHDPYGGHPQIGTPPYVRVVPGAVHEAHEGVLFIDEVSSLAFLQRFVLTAMQEKKYAIAGRNPTSSGASVRVDGVPCDFILVAASNINDLPSILPPLRSRVLGNGYEIVLDTFMPDSEANRLKLLQFMAQEVRKDGRIPHLDAGAAFELVDEARRRAKEIDGADGALTLRLRELSGILRLAGDEARAQNAELITRDAVRLATRRGRSAEEQLKDRYGSVWKAGARESAQQASKGDQKEIS